MANIKYLSPGARKAYQQAVARERKSSSSSGSSSSSSSSGSKVIISGDTVFIDGQGYSVAPTRQAEFIKERTGGRGSSAQAAIQSAEQTQRVQQALNVQPARQAPSAKKITPTKSKDTILLKGQGYSVAPTKRNAFISTIDPQYNLREKLKSEKYVYDNGRTYFYQNGNIVSIQGRLGKADQIFYSRILGSDPSLTPLPEAKKGDQFSLRYFQMFAGRKASDLTESSGIKIPRVLSKPAPEFATEIVAELPTWSAFSPLIRTGTSQRLESEYSDEVVEVVYNGKRVKMTLSDARRLGLEPMTRTQATGEFSRASKERQISIIKKSFEGRVYLDRTSLNSDINRAINFMKEAGLSNKEIADILKQVPQIKAITPQASAQEVSTVIQKTTSGMFAPTQSGNQVIGVEMKGLEFITTPTSTLKPSSVGETQWTTSQQGQELLSKLGLKASTKSLFDVKQDTKTETKVDTRQSTFQNFTPITQTTTITTTAQKTSTNTVNIPKFQTPQIPKIETPQIPKIQTPTLPRSPTARKTGRSPQKETTFPKIPLIKFSSSSILPTESRGTQVGFIPQAYSKGKWINLSRQPLSREAALGRMARTLDNTTAARGRIKKKKGKILNVNDNYFSINQGKFRPYKIRKGRAIQTPNQFIEKRSNRIDTLGEARGLKAAQFVKQNNWLVGTKKKPKTKPRRKPAQKRKTKSPWLV